MRPIRNVYDINMLKKLRGNTKKAEFARQLGITRHYYHYLENGEVRELPFDVVQALKTIFKLTPEEVCRLMGLK